MNKGKKHNSSKSKQFVTKQAVKSMLAASIENVKKFNDSVTAVPTLGTSVGTITCNMPATGAGEQTMAGTSIDITEFELHYEFYDLSAATSTTSYACRCLVVQALGIAPLTIASVLQLNSTAQAVLSPYRYEEVGKTFRVLYDRVSFVDSYNTRSLHVAKFRPKVHRLRLDAGTGWSTGQVYIMYVTANNGVLSTLNFDSYLRMNWLDS